MSKWIFLDKVAKFGAATSLERNYGKIEFVWILRNFSEQVFFEDPTTTNSAITRRKHIDPACFFVQTRMHIDPACFSVQRISAVTRRHIDPVWFFFSIDFLQLRGGILILLVFLLSEFHISIKT